MSLIELCFYKCLNLLNLTCNMDSYQQMVLLFLLHVPTGPLIYIYETPFPVYPLFC